VGSGYQRLIGLAFLLVLSGCAKPVAGPDASPAELAAACDRGDLDACSRAAHARSDAYEAAMRLN
jgi:hypothetical protein